MYTMYKDFSSHHANHSNEPIEVQLMQELEEIVAARLEIQNEPYMKEFLKRQESEIKPIKKALRAAEKIIDDQLEKIYEPTQSINDDEAKRLAQNRLKEEYQATSAYQDIKQEMTQNKEKLIIKNSELKKFAEENNLTEKIKELARLKEWEAMKESKIKIQEEIEDKKEELRLFDSLVTDHVAELKKKNHVRALEEIYGKIREITEQMEDKIDDFERLLAQEMILHAHENGEQDKIIKQRKTDFNQLQEQSELISQKEIHHFGNKQQPGSALNLLAMHILELKEVIKMRNEYYHGTQHSDFKYKALKNKLMDEVEGLQSWHELSTLQCIKAYEKYELSYQQVIKKMMACGETELLISIYKAGAVNIRLNISSRKAGQWEALDERVDVAPDGKGQTAEMLLANGYALLAEKIKELEKILKVRNEYYNGTFYKDSFYKSLQAEITDEMEELQTWKNLIYQSTALLMHYESRYQTLIKKLLAVPAGGEAALFISIDKANAIHVKNDLLSTKIRVTANAKEEIMWKPIDEDKQDGLGKTLREWIAEKNKTNLPVSSAQPPASPPLSPVWKKTR